MFSRLVTPGLSGEEYTPGRESVRAREMIVRIVAGGVVSRILEDLSREDLDIFLSGLVSDAMRGYAPI